MRRKRGIFVVFEGTDGSGKTSQFRALVSRLRRSGMRPVLFDFPQYGKSSSYFVREYLNGRYGTWREVGPYAASVFYALDRFDVAARIRRARAAGRIVVANRYVSSNMGHQGAKIVGRAARLRYFRWLHDLEYRVLGVPRPDLTLVLHVPAATAQRLVDRKGSREYIGGVKRDLHEADIKHLKQAEATYLDMVRIFPREYRIIECMKGKTLLAVRDIHEKVWRVVSPLVK